MSTTYQSPESAAIDKPSLIIAGASVRAAAASALRAGFRPWCADLFADVDLQRGCDVVRLGLRDYPEAIRSVLKSAPPGPWLYTGALENRPGLIAGVERPLWGNPADVVRRVRDPKLVAAALERRGLPAPRVSFAQPDGRQRWLVKPCRGAGGLHIRFWRPGETFNPRRFYLQEWIEGPSYAALFLGRPDDAELVGVTRQLVGEPWLHARPFQYCGSIGPMHLGAAATDALHRLGQALVRDFNVRGLFGVDFVLRDGLPWPVEINPRYTASVEIIERAGSRVLLAEHAAVFRGSAEAARPERASPCRTPLEGVSPGVVNGKAILFAPRPLRTPGIAVWQPALALGLADPRAPYADIPRAGETLDAGAPICTIFAAGTTVAECRNALRERAAELAARLGAVRLNSQS